MRSGRFVLSFCLSVILSVCLSVCYCKVISRFHWNLMLWLGYQSEELINFWWWSGPGHGFRIIFPLPSPVRIGDFRRFISISHIQSLADFYDTRRNYWRRQDNESTTFWEQSGRHPNPAGLIRKSGFESRITYSVDVRRLGGGLRFLSIVSLCDASTCGIFVWPRTLAGLYRA